ncbi:MAG: hypothetical protein ACQEXX_17690 [Bacillota bacterium]
MKQANREFLVSLLVVAIYETMEYLKKSFMMYNLGDDDGHTYRIDADKPD